MGFRRVLFRSGLTPRAWLYVAIAFAIGIGLFLLIWAKQRAEDDFYRTDTSRQSATGQVFEPLPQPDSGDAGLDNAPPAADDAAPSARIVETQPPPPPPGPAVPTQPAAPGTPVAGQAGALDSPPLHTSRPAPPRNASSWAKRSPIEKAIVGTGPLQKKK